VICQWCRRPLLMPITERPEFAFCQYGCTKGPSFRNRCIDCHREYETGRPHSDQCPACEEKEDARYRAQGVGEEIPPGYTMDMIRNGAARRAMWKK
jgi:hypothetical protein